MGSSAAAAGVTGYPFDGYTGSDASFAALMGGPEPANPPAAPGATETDSPPVGSAGHASGVNASESPAAVNVGGTFSREDGKVRCANFDTCGTWVKPGGKTGCCSPCVRNMWRTGQMRHPQRNDVQKTDPRERAALMARMMTAAGRRALEEDPGDGLAILLDVQARVDALVKTVGMELLAGYMARSSDGLSAMADDLTYSTGTAWSKQRVHKRWAAKQNGQVPADA